MFFESCPPPPFALLSLLRCFWLLRGLPPFGFFLMYHCFFIFLFTKRIMLFVLSTVKQSLLQHWKAISLYEMFTMYLLWLTFDSSSLLFTCTLGVIIEVNLFYTNTKSVLWQFVVFFSPHSFCEISILRETDQLSLLETRKGLSEMFWTASAIFCCCRWVTLEIINKIYREKGSFFKSRAIHKLFFLL